MSEKCDEGNIHDVESLNQERKLHWNKGNAILNLNNK